MGGVVKAKSIIQDTKRCYLCGNTQFLHNHHIFPGSRRQLSDRLGLTVYLCARCHGIVHTDPQTIKRLQVIGQRKYEETHTREDFIRTFGKSFILEE